MRGSDIKAVVGSPSYTSLSASLPIPDVVTGLWQLRRLPYESIADSIPFTVPAQRLAGPVKHVFDG